MAQARGGLVEQQQLRAHHQRARQLDGLADPEREPERRPVRDAGETQPLEHVERFRARGRLAAVRAEPARKAGVVTDQRVLEHGHVVEQRDVLERPRDSQARDLLRRAPQQIVALEPDRAGRRLVQPGDAVEAGRLAGAVRPDQPGDVAFGDVEGHVVQRRYPAEPDRQVANLEQRRQRAYFSAIVVERVSTSTPVGDQSVPSHFAAIICVIG